LIEVQSSSINQSEAKFQQESEAKFNQSKAKQSEAK
jgi:hypothetical protein